MLKNSFNNVKYEVGARMQNLRHDFH